MDRGSDKTGTGNGREAREDSSVHSQTLKHVAGTTIFGKRFLLFFNKKRNFEEVCLPVLENTPF